MNSLLKKFSLSKLDLFVLIIITFLGIINLPVPFGGDQALFITGAQEMANGGVLYKDFWDFKPPGIYYFYYAAGSIFGFSEIGIHLLELLCWLFLSLFLIIAFKSANTFENKFIASLVPLFTVGIYYSLTTAYSLTQVEGLINIFLFLTLWFAVASIKPNGKRFYLILLSGLIGGVVLTFKLMFLPIIGVFWLTALLSLILKQKEKPSHIFKTFFIPLAIGIFVPIAILLIYYFEMGLLYTVYKTFFIYPPRLVTETPLGGYSKLYNLFLFYINRFYPMIAVALFGIFLALWYKKDLILINIILWLILGSIVILITRISWWQYHLHLLNVPVGILFLVSIDFIWYSIKKYDIVNSWKGKIIAALVLIVLFQSAFHASIPKAKFFLNYISAQSTDSRKELLSNSEKDYAFTYQNIDILLQENTLEGEIFAAATPLFYYLSDRSQGIAINGWVLELLLPELWDEFNKQLKKNKPVYIFFDGAYMKLVPNLSSETVKFIKEQYSIERHTKHGIWFVDKDKLNNNKSLNY